MVRAFVRSVVVVALFASRPLVAQSVERAPPLILRPGDAVRVEVKDEPGLSGEFQVGQDDTTLLPALGLLDVGGRPFPAVEADILQRYREQLVAPVVRITPLVRVAVLGEVRRPGLFPVDPTHSIYDVLAAAGGQTPSANGKVSLVRDGDVVTWRLAPDAPEQQLGLRSGDRIIVERRSWLSENTPFFIGALGSVAAAAIASIIVQ